MCVAVGVVGGGGFMTIHDVTAGRLSIIGISCVTHTLHSSMGTFTFTLTIELGGAVALLAGYRT